MTAVTGIAVEPLSAGHLAALRLQARQAYLAAELTPAMAGELLAAGPAFTALAAGRPIAAAGVMVRGFAMPTAWGLLTAGLGRRFVPVHRAVAAFLARFGGAVQTGIEPGHAEGERWARLLGFAPVGPWTDWESAHGRAFVRWVRHGDRHGA